MIPDWPTTLVAFVVAAVFFTALGLPLARTTAPRGIPPLAIAPALGWAVYAVLSLPILALTGFAPLQIWLFSLASLALAWTLRPRQNATPMPLWPVALAAAMAWLPAMAIMPKYADGGILLGPPMFDHVKIALIDDILRTGLPVPNPFYGPENPGSLAYYYLWHFSTAVLAGGLHIGGWSADAAMTAFTAFASLSLMIGVAIALGGRTISIAALILLSLAGSMRPILNLWLGSDGAHRIVIRDADFGGWLNQAAWVPQHLASACCVILSALLMLKLSQAGSLLCAALLGLTVAAGFESSIWVGGIAFAAAGAALGLTLLWQTSSAERLIFLLRATGAVIIAAILMAPFIAAELHAVGARAGGAGIAFSPYAMLGSAFPTACRAILDAAAFGPLFLPFELPAVFPFGLAALFILAPSADRRLLLKTVTLIALSCLIVAWLFRSTIDNNDLGWRAVLPAVLLLTVAAACLLEHLVVIRRWKLLLPALILAAFGIPDAAQMIRLYATGQRPGDPATFAQSEALWQAVRRHTGPQDRIGINPLFDMKSAPWPVDLSWALLSDRPSCYAGWATVVAYGSVPKPHLLEISARFLRVFDAKPLLGDIDALAHENNCAAVVVTRHDAAWGDEALAGAGMYDLAERSEDWAIYVRKKK